MKQTDLKKMFGSVPDRFADRVAFAIRETEEKPMKQKLTARTALIAAAILVMLMAAAYAAFSSQVTAFFGTLYGQDTQEWLEKGDVATPNRTFTLDDVVFTLDEVVYRDNGLYGVGTIRADEGSTAVIFPEDQQPSDPYGYDVYGISGNEPEKAPAGAKTFADMAKGTGGRLLMVRALPDLIGVDGGELLSPNAIGYTLVPQRDGSVQYSFEVSDGVVVEKGETYTIQMWVSAWEFSAAGKPLSERPKGENWTVEIAPAPIHSATPVTAETSAGDVTQMEADVEDGWEFIVPEEYTQTGTLPVYRAIPRDFGGDLKPELFNQSGILSRENGQVVYTDEAILVFSPESLFYGEYNGTFDANESNVSEDGSKPSKPDMIPLGALSDAITKLATWAAHGWPDTGIVYELDKTTLTYITQAEAKQTLETLFAELNLTDYVCENTLDMSVERIVELGAELKTEETFFADLPPYNFSTATVADEGFYLCYRKSDESRGLSIIQAYATERGIVNLSIREEYTRGEVYSTPEALVDYHEVLSILPTEINASLFPEKLVSILEVRLNYSAMRAANKADGMVLTPTWLVIYLDESAVERGYTCWAEFNAVDGKLLNATFK